MAENLSVVVAGWYAYLTEEAAIIGSYNILKDIKVCYAKASWIKGLGTFNGRPAGIFTHLYFPDWDKGDMTIREFRAMCREQK